MNTSVAEWLKDLTADPVQAIDRLVMGRVAVPVWSRASLGEILLDVIAVQRDDLDAGVVGWLDQRLLRVPPNGLSDEVWGAYLQDLFRAITSLDLPQVARLLRSRVRDFRAWLRPLVREANLDPEAAFLTALAWCEQNQHLEGFWRNLALRLRHEPLEYTDIGLLGLRKMRDDGGQLPAKAPFLLLATLIDLADAPGTQRVVWERTTRVVLAGYHLSQETWVREFKPVIESRPDAQNGREWLRHIVPVADPTPATARPGSTSTSQPSSLAETNEFVEGVEQGGPNYDAARLNAYLARHRNFASIHNNPYYLVRTFNRFAEAAKDHDPEWAIARIQEALDWDPGNVRNWTVLARCHWSRRERAIAQGQTEQAIVAESEAFDALWEARRRFPSEAFVRTELARFYRDAGDLTTAEDIYREAEADFPNNPVPRCGIADVKRLQGDLAEAERLYRAAILDFPTNPYPYTGLADMFFERSCLAHDETEREAARHLFQHAAKLGNSYASNFLSGFDQRWAEKGRQKVKKEATLVSQAAAQLLSQKEDDMGPAQRLGRALLALRQASRATLLAEKEHLWARSSSLLSLADSLTGECYEEFIEARGFVLLARQQFAEARSYFEQQLNLFAPRRPSGLVLGLAEARRGLNESVEDEPELNRLSERTSCLLLPLVFKVVQWCQTHGSDEVLRAVLLQAFPLVRNLLPAASTTSETEADDTASSRAPDTPDKMLAEWLTKRVFEPADIKSESDLQDAGKMAGVKNALRIYGPDLQSVAYTLAMAA